MPAPRCLPSARQLAARGCRRSPLLRRLLLPSLLRTRFHRRTGLPLNLQSPSLFAEKIQWLKIHGHLENLAPLVDKLAVRETVTRLASPNLLIPLLAVHTRGAEVPWSDLGPQHVVKTNHGSGWTLMMADHLLTPPETLTRLIDSWLATHYFDTFYEPQYLPIPPRILIETRIGDTHRTTDVHRLYCQNGEPHLVMIDVFKDRQRYNATFTPSGQRIPGRVLDPDYPGPLPPPACLDTLLATARTLAAPFPFVRIDLYQLDGHLYFSEFTFTPDAGETIAQPRELELRRARLVDLPACARAFRSLQV